jgi:hypothetical protein
METWNMNIIPLYLRKNYIIAGIAELGCINFKEKLSIENDISKRESQTF